MPPIDGERWVGKSSLANVLKEILEPRQRDLLVAKINCEEMDTLPSIIHKLFHQLLVYKSKTGAGFIKSRSGSAIRLAELLPESVDAGAVRELVEAVPFPLLLIIDEFDRMENRSTIGSVCDLIKTFSDYAVKATVVIVGVGDSVEELIKEHQSVERSLVQVHLPRMSKAELEEIIDRGLKSVPMTMEPEAADYITSLSQGLPHYTHLLAQYAARAATDEGTSDIQMEAVERAIEEAIKRTQESTLNAYVKATTSSKPNALFREVLLACALAKSDELGCFSAGAVREPMEVIMKRRYEIPGFAQHLQKFCAESRGSILQKTGSPKTFRYRFVNPLMQPYIILQGLAERKIDKPSVGMLMRAS